MKNATRSKLGNGERGLRYEVWRSAFHGGKLLSKHRSPRAAVRSQRAAQTSDCMCGCAYILDTQTGYCIDPRDLPRRRQS